MKIWILAVVLVGVDVCTDALVTMKVVSKIDKWLKNLKNDDLKKKFEVESSRDVSQA